MRAFRFEILQRFWIEILYAFIDLLTSAVAQVDKAPKINSGGTAGFTTCG
jgi:hypothetical protein